MYVALTAVKLLVMSEYILANVNDTPHFGWTVAILPSWACSRLRNCSLSLAAPMELEADRPK